jgi:hypothetical protein
LSAPQQPEIARSGLGEVIVDVATSVKWGR